VDIRAVMADTNEVGLTLVAQPPPAGDPTEQWIAYGVVIDEDGDGVPDWRYGMDNIPADAAENGPPRRGWRTNLHTGQTEAGPEHGEAVWRNGGGFKSGLRFGSVGLSPDATFRFGGTLETTQGMQGWGFELDMPFYTWASVIVNGRVVATDYAPDAGWLVPTRGVWPGGTLLIGDPLPNLSVAVPQGWTRSEDGHLNRVACGDLARHFAPDEAIDSPYCAFVRFEVIQSAPDQIYPLRDVEEICDDTINPPLGPSFDDLVTYVAGLPGIVTPGDADLTVNGHRGKHFQYSPVRGGPDCSWDASDIWIFDVDGVRLMIRSNIGGDYRLNVPKEAAKSEIRQMVESIHFER
jgi:hypothetical protein